MSISAMGRMGFAAVRRRTVILAAASALGVGAAGRAAAQTTTLRVFIGGNNRIDVMRRLFDGYEQRHPGMKLVIESGGATSDLQRRYLATVLSARDPSLDVMQIDIVNPAQFLAAKWIEPLGEHLGVDAKTVLAAYLPAHARANLVGSVLATLPAYADVQLLYYRRDLLDKHGLPPPRSWDELEATARRVLAAERRSDPLTAAASKGLQGLSIQGAPIEGATCTFLTPYWSQGKELIDAAGRLSLDTAAAERGLSMWLRLVDAGVIGRNVAEVKTQDTTSDFRGGRLLFAVNWGQAWSRFQEADSPVRGKVGVAALPAMAGGTPASCAGGWQWAVSAFSGHKPQAVALLRWLASPEVAKAIALQASMLPAIRSLYDDPELLAALPWIADALPALEAARARPVTPRYSEVSDVLRTTTAAVLGRSRSPDQAVLDVQSRLRRVLR